MELRLWPTKYRLHVEVYRSVEEERSIFVRSIMADRIPPKEGDTLNIPKFDTLAGAVMASAYDKTTPPVEVRGGLTHDAIIDDPRDPYEGVDVVIKTVVDIDADGDPAALTVTHDKRTGKTDVRGGKLDE